MSAGWQVVIMEYERDWGSRVDEVRTFDTEEEADAFVARFNAVNTAATAPDWYMVAHAPQAIPRSAPPPIDSVPPTPETPEQSP